MKTVRVNTPNKINAQMHWLSQMTGLNVKLVHLALLVMALSQKNEMVLIDDVKTHAKTIATYMAEEAKETSKAKK